MYLKLLVKHPTKIAESPYWDYRLSELFWIDCAEKTIHRFNYHKQHFVYSLFQDIGCIVPTDNPFIILAALQNCYGFFDIRTQRFKCLGYLETEYPENRFNDGICDSKNRFFFGSMCPSTLSSPQAAVYRLEGSQCIKILDGFYTVNGMAFSPDETIFYVSDSHPNVQTIWAFNYNSFSGELSNRTIFFFFFYILGRPDGATIDEKGGYWISCIDGSQIIRLLPGGVVDEVIKVPIDSPTKVAFGGKDLKTLFITSKSSSKNYSKMLYSVKLRIKGLKVKFFKHKN
ncbi:MAG: SMP-30/gluconolactonase/LRE family protein [Ignavibacteriae bacterium]|nr:SMP-30/gluconolactonase/LRE family protein [Ignavibacteriota bacterium]